MTIKVSARMTHWGIRLVSLGFVFGFVGPAQPAVQACDIYCVPNERVPAGEHYAYQIPRHSRWYEHEASKELRQLPRPVRLAPGEELDALEHAVIAADRAKVQSILDEHPSLTVNIERSALQQLDCGGTLWCISRRHRR